MKLTDQIKEMIENAKSEEEVKTILENVKEGAEDAGLILDDEDLDRVSGGWSQTPGKKWDGYIF